MARTGSLLKTLRRDEEGSTTVEFVIWTPLLAAGLMLILDLSYMMIVDAGLWNASRDTARAVAQRRVTTDEAEALFAERMFPRNVEYRFGIDVAEDEVHIQVLVDGEDTALSPFLPKFYEGTIGASLRMLMEPA